MVDYHYDDNLYKQMAKRGRLKVVLYTFLAVVFVVSGLMLFDILKSKTSQTVVESNATSILGLSEEKTIFDEKYFRIEADKYWSKVNKVTNDRYKDYDPFRYRKVVDGLVKQEIIIFVDNIPEEYELTYVLPIEVDGNKIRPFEISPKCGELMPEDSKTAQTIKWAGVKFICTPELMSYIAGTSHNEFGYGTKVPGTNSVHRYFFVFIDSQPTPKFSTFSTILRTFNAK